ncbi:THAP domain-containing protein 1-like [Symphorus nematophorus]
MGKSCCAIKCTNRFDKDSELSFHRVPKAKEKRGKWIAALQRDNLNPDTEAWVCGRHFVSGKKSDDPLHPDYVPSLFSFTSTADRMRAVINLEKYLQSQKDVSEARPQASPSRETAAPAPVIPRQSRPSHSAVHIIQVRSTAVQTEETQSDVDSLHEEIKSLKAECLALRAKVHKLEHELKR